MPLNVATDRLIASIRDYQRFSARAGLAAKLGRKWSRLRYEYWSAVTSSDINLGARLGKNLRLPHPNGVVIHQRAVVGDDCLIMQQTTLGQLEDDAAPRLGNGVYIGAGAKVLGPVSIGDGARIGANAVVLADVPAHSTAVGIPARVVRSTDMPGSTTAAAYAARS